MVNSIKIAKELLFTRDGRTQLSLGILESTLANSITRQVAYLNYQLTKEYQSSLHFMMHFTPYTRQCDHQPTACYLKFIQIKPALKFLSQDRN